MIKWLGAVSIAGREAHSLIHSGEYEGVQVQAEIRTPVISEMEFGEGKMTFYIVGDERTFKTEEELREAIEVDRNNLEV